MKCHDVRKTLTAYLDSEATPLEQKELRDHIAECATCRTELATLSRLQSHLHRAMKIEAAQVASSPEAWKHLQSRLANEHSSPSARGNGLLHRLILLGSTHREADRKNKPASDMSQQEWSPAIDPAAAPWWHQKWWHHGLVWAAKWSRKATGRSLKKPLTIWNRQAKDDEPDVE